jgi:probable rRNA maturation factor
MPSEITLYNRQRKVSFDMAALRAFAPVALAEALANPAHPAAPLPSLAEVEVTFVSDATIARVHKDFMDIPGATDVITFDHGEIIISTETAHANAPLYHRTLNQELALYLIHGLLHLNGFEDKEPEDAKKMHRLQEEILQKCFL